MNGPNRVPSRTARPPSSGWVGGSAELTQGRHHLRRQTFLLLVAPPADPEVEHRETEVEELEQALDDLIGFARDPSFGIVGGGPPIRTLTLYA